MSPATASDRMTFYPARYRACFATVAGPAAADFSSAEAAWKFLGGQGYVLAQWFLKGGGLDSERVPRPASSSTGGKP